MALTVTAGGTANSTSSSASLALNAGVRCEAKDWIVVCVAADNNGTNGATSTTGVTDAAGNTYTLRADRLQDPGAAGDGVSLRVYVAPCTVPLSATQQITVAFSPNTTSKAAAVWRIRPAASGAVNFLGESGTVAATANPTHTTASMSAGQLVIGATAAETNVTPTADSDTTNGTWSTAQVATANTGTAGTSAVLTTQFKVVTATATQTYNTTLVANDHAVSCLRFSEVAAAESVGASRLTVGRNSRSRMIR